MADIVRFPHPRPCGATVGRPGWALSVAGLLALAGMSGPGASLAARPAVAPGTQPSAQIAPPTFPAGVQRLHYRYGPLVVRPGSNMILLGGGVPKPQLDGYIVGMRPNLTLADGTVPSVNVIHLHHGVWINLSAHNPTLPSEPELFFASGEEKTRTQLPRGYGYPYHASDRWAINYMLHNLTPVAFTVYINYEIDFIPGSSAAAASLRPAYPLWMDVQNGKAYPVFDAHRGAGARGRFTYPDDLRGAYGHGPVRNEWTVPRAATLVSVSGHLHPGGLYDTLDVVRAGASVARAARGRAPVAGAVPHSVRVFRSQAHYWDPQGAVSWDMAMTVSPPGWRVGLQAGDVLRVNSTYDTRRHSWYEVMGIMVAYVSWSPGGPDPFRHAVATSGHITHGVLAENADPLGGIPVANLPDPLAELGTSAPQNTVQIRNFTYAPGVVNEKLGRQSRPPVVRRGQSLAFVNDDNGRGIYHTVTACSSPCTATTGSHYPLADTAPAAAFDSAELGTGPTGFTAASGSITWNTPASLPTGTYSYFCRVHPFMRGAFRVVP